MNIDQHYYIRPNEIVRMKENGFQRVSARVFRLQLPNTLYSSLMNTSTTNAGTAHVR